MMSRFFVLISLVFSSSSLTAGEGSADVREQCRAAVSGTYLNFMNDLDLLKITLASSSEAGFALKARKKLSVKELQGLESKNEALKVPASDLDEELVGLRNAIDSTTDSIQDTEVRIVTVKDQIAVKEKAFKEFQDKIRTVFEVQKASGVSQGAYPIRLQYRHGCSEYKLLCPLPKAQAESLFSLSRVLEDSIACQRYAQIH